MKFVFCDTFLHLQPKYLISIDVNLVYIEDIYYCTNTIFLHYKLSNTSKKFNISQYKQKYLFKIELNNDIVKSIYLCIKKS